MLHLQHGRGVNMSCEPWESGTLGRADPSTDGRTCPAARDPRPVSRWVLPTAPISKIAAAEAILEIGAVGNTQRDTGRGSLAAGQVLPSVDGSARPSVPLSHGSQLMFTPRPCWRWSMVHGGQAPVM